MKKMPQAVDGFAEFQVVEHLQLGEADVDAVQPGQHPQHAQKGQQAPGNLGIGGVDLIDGNSVPLIGT
jgi:hypothetical protein